VEEESVEKGVIAGRPGVSLEEAGVKLLVSTGVGLTVWEAVVVGGG
jgi:hypothetical protein